MSKPNKYLLIIVAVLFMGAGAGYYVYHRDHAQPIQQAQPPAPSAGSGTSTAVPESNHQVAPENPYVLKILGSSSNLSEKQKNSMSRWREQVEEMARKRPEGIVLNGPASRSSVSLTFDDGPDSEITPQILEILKKEGVKASFFVTGQQCNKFPLQVQKINDQGHLVLSHTYSHRQLDLTSRETVNQEITMTDQAIDKLTGRTPRGVRPPYGAVNQMVVDALDAQGKLTILWSIDTLDWAGDEAVTVAANVLDNVRPGDIILMHSIGGRTNTVKALPVIIKGLREKGYTMVRIDELLQREL
ncbi:MAG: polysaccharide deacetylase family protein [Syntrophomonadaceae bacterium]